MNTILDFKYFMLAFIVNIYIYINHCLSIFINYLLFYSNAAYHGDFLKKAEMEQRRNLSNGSNTANINEIPGN